MINPKPTLPIYELERYFNQLLTPGNYRGDYAPNGLQIAGATDLSTLCFAVSATAESIELAIQLKAEALIVHHGVFWNKQGARPLVGPFGEKRVLPLARHWINLFAYHLPLDGHQTMGNAASIAQLLGLKNCRPFGHGQGGAGIMSGTTTSGTTSAAAQAAKMAPLGIAGDFPHPVTGSELKRSLEQVLQHSIVHADPYTDEKTIQSMGIITGGAGHDWPLAHAAGLDAFLTGEISEHHWHEAREAGLHFFAGGHHATEVFGIQHLMRLTQNQFPQLTCHFLPSANPA
jgi:dinuclear metal center YbgI/SA1388 family protein